MNNHWTLVEGSRTNWQKSSDLAETIRTISWWVNGCLGTLFNQVERRRHHEGLRCPHWYRMCSKSSCSFSHVGARQKPSLLLDQNRQSFSVLNLPDNIFACTQALFTSYGELRAVVQRWWGFIRDIYWGLKYLREEQDVIRKVLPWVVWRIA